MAEQVTASLGDEEAELRSAELTECSRTVPHACRDSIATMEEEGIEQTHNNTKRESPDMEDLDSFNLIEPPPLDWRSDSSSEAPCSVEEMDEPGTFHAEVLDAPADLPSDITTQDTNSSSAQTLSCQGRSSDQPGHDVHKPQDEKHVQEEEEVAEVILDKTLEEIRRGEEVAHDVPVEGRRNMELLDTSEEGWRREQEVQETHEEYWRREEEVEETLEEGWRREGEVQETLEEGWRSKQEVQETLEEGWRSKQEVPETVDERRKVKESWRDNDTDHSHIQTLLTQLQLVQPTPPEEASIAPPSASFIPDPNHSPCPTEWSGGANGTSEESSASGLLFTERHQRDVQDLLEDYDPEQAGSELSVPQAGLIRPSLRQPAGSLHSDQNLPVSIGQQEQQPVWHRRPLQGSTNWQAPGDEFVMSGYPDEELLEAWQQSVAAAEGEESSASKPEEGADDRPAYKDVPGPCDPEDLLEGVIFGAKYLGSTQMQSEKNPSTNARMTQAQEAVDRIKAPEGESQPQTEVDLFISTQRIKVLSADTQEAMMDHALQMISYIADIGNVVVLMARRKPSSRKTPESTGSSSTTKKKCWMICHVFSSEDASVIAQAIGQAFGVAYQQFLQANGIKSSQLPPGEYSDYLGTQELYNGDLVHFSCSENIREVCIDKQAGEALGVAVVESGWGSILPTVVVANLLHGGPAERCGELSIGDRVMSVNGTSLVGLPIATCQNIIRELKPQTQVKLSIVHCPPVTMAIIRRPDPKYQLGFSVEDGIICSLMRGGIAERGGIRVGHRIIEINGQSVVATPHEKIIHILTQAVGEIHLKTMPASTYRLLTGQEQPVFL